MIPINSSLHDQQTQDSQHGVLNHNHPKQSQKSIGWSDFTKVVGKYWMVIVGIISLIGVVLVFGVQSGKIVLFEDEYYRQCMLEKLNRIQPTITKPSTASTASTATLLGTKQGSFSPFNSTIVPQTVMLTFQTHLQLLLRPHNDTNCNYTRFGDYRDGGYVMCNNELEEAVALLNFGVEGRDQFGCQLTGNYTIPNYQYDCTNQRQPKCQSNGCNNYFNFVCLSNESKVENKIQSHSQNVQANNAQNISRTYMSLKDIIDTLNLTRKHIIIKIDIQSAQWPTFETLPLSYLDYIDQIIMEIHSSALEKHYAFPAQWGHLDIIGNIMQKYVNVNFHVNNFGCLKGDTDKGHLIPSNAFQVSLINKKLITINKPTKSYVENQLNRANSDYLYNCKMTEPME